jgi:hypothetical protein
MKLTGHILMAESTGIDGLYNEKETRTRTIIVRLSGRYWMIWHDHKPSKPK